VDEKRQDPTADEAESTPAQPPPLGGAPSPSTEDTGPPHMLARAGLETPSETESVPAVAPPPPYGAGPLVAPPAQTGPVWRGAEPPVVPGWPPPGGPPPSSFPGAPGGTESTPGPRSGPRGARGWIVVAVVAALIGGAAGAGIAEAVGTGNNSASAPPVRVGEETPGPALAGGAQIPTIVKSVLPEVVSIDAKDPGSANGGPFGSGASEDQGTGMIISGTGEVITNNHVISGATTITVTLYGQTAALPATLIGADPSSDAALLKIDSPPANLQEVTFGDSTKLQVGDAVIAIGNALGLSAGTPTVTSGIVSATGRTVQAGDGNGGAGETLQNLIQTDAAINSGNSGGPLVDSAGQVVGMDTAVASSSTGNAPAQNIGFAIPSSTIQGLVATLRAGGTAGKAKAYLGVEVTDETSQEQQAYGLVPSSGALVVSVVSGSPADSAGVRTGDVVVTFNGKAVTSAQGLTNDVQALSSGTVVHFTVYRGQQKLALTAKLGLAPAG
jgi:S1-C subfamily serine protease